MAQTKVKLISDGVIDVGHLASGHGITTDNIGEGSNLYYTDARVSTYLSTNNYATESWVNSNFLTAESDTLQSVVSRGSSVANTITIDGGNFEIFNTSLTDRRLTFNQSSGAIPRIYNFDQVASSFHAIKIGGGNNDTTGLLVGDGNSPDTIVFGNLGVGVSSATKRLDVDGAIRTRNSFNISDGTTQIGGLFPYKVITGSGTDNSTALFAENGLDLHFMTNGSVSSKMVIKSGGNVGIGTTTPATLLTTVGSAYSVSNSGRSVGGILVYADSGGVGGYGGAISFGTGGLGSSAIAAVSGPGSDRDVNGLAFFTHGSSSGLADSSEAMRIQHDGNVGIGTTSPNAKLHVGSTGTNSYSSTITKGSNMKGLVATVANNADDMVGIYFATGSTTEGTHWSGITGSRSNNASHWGTQLNFYTHNNDVNALNDATQKMVIKGDGKVGIGTTSPQAKLHTNQSLQGSLLSYLNGTSTTFDGDANLLAVHNSPSIGNATGAGLVLANNDKSVNAISPIIAFAAKSDSNTYNHTYAAIYGTRTGAGADSNWVVGDLVFATNYNTGPLERVRIKGGTGNVGINQSSPRHKLHIINSSVGSNLTKAIMLSCDPSVGGGNAIFFKTSGNDTDDRYGVKLGAVRSVNNNGSSEFLIQMESANMAGMENVFRINRDRKVIIGEATGYDGDLASRNGWVLNYTGGGGTTVNFSGSNEIFTFNQRDGQGTTQVDFRNGNVERGRIEWTTSATTYNTTSDYRLKENVVDLSDSLSKLSLLQPKQFNFISDPEDIRIGFIAHEVQEVVPQAVSGEKDAIREDGTPKYQGLDHSMLVPLLVGAIKELKAEVEALKQQLNG